MEPEIQRSTITGSQGDEVAKSGSKPKQFTFSPYACCNSAVSGPEGTCVGRRVESGGVRNWQRGMDQPRERHARLPISEALRKLPSIPEIPIHPLSFQSLNEIGNVK